MKYTITIEETCAEDFEIDANNAEEAYGLAERKYKAGECQFRQIAITKPSCESTEWREF